MDIKSLSRGALFVVAFLYILSVNAFAAETAVVESKTTTVKPSKKSESLKRAMRVPVANEAESLAKVEAVADSLEFQKDTGKLIARGNAVITYQNIKIISDYAEVETNTKKAFAKGHVMIFKDEKPNLKGEEIYYDFENKTGSFPNAKLMNEPWFARGEDVLQLKEKTYQINNGAVTTCNLAKPHYEIRSKKATLYSDEKLVLSSATIYVLGKPVFWLPRMTIPLYWRHLPFQISAGYSKRYGAYVELSKGFVFNKNLWGRALLDWRSKRGFGAGWNQYYDYGKIASGSIKTYLTQDKRAPIPNRPDPYSEEEDRNRGRITWRHRSDFGENTHILARYHRAADRYLLQDFFEEEYRNQMQPNSFITATHNTERYGIMLHATSKMNNYEAMVERLPELRLDWKNQPFFTDKIFNESRVQADNLVKRYAYTSEKQKLLRADAYTRCYVPLKWDDASIMPFVGYRATEYSRQVETKSSIFRNTLEYGIDIRNHYYKFFDVSFDELGIEVNQLRHIFEPSITVKGTETSMRRTKVVHYDSVDRLRSNQEVILGMANRLQTKRVVDGKMKRVDFVSMNTFLHFEGSPQDPDANSASFTVASNEITLRPYEWLQFRNYVEYDASRDYLKFANTDMIIRKGPAKLTLGHRYAHQHQDWYFDEWIDTSDQFTIDLRYQINKLWELGGYVRFDNNITNEKTTLDDTPNGLQEWEISATRDLHDFILEFGYNCRRSRIDRNNNQIFVQFQMKALPGIKLGSAGKSGVSEPRIGETVAGANEYAAWRDRNPLLSEFDRFANH